MASAVFYFVTMIVLSLPRAPMRPHAFISRTPRALGSILFEDVGDDFFRNRRLRCEKQIIDNSIVAVPHWQRVGNEFKPSDSFEALLKRFHNRVVVLFDKFPPEKVALITFGISSLTP